MKFATKSAALAKATTACLILGVYEKGGLAEAARELAESTRKYITDIVKQGDINGKAGQVLLLHNVPDLQARRVLLVGCGKQGKLDAKKFANLLRHTIQTLEKHRISDALFTLTSLVGDDLDIEARARLTAQIFASSQYRYSKTLTRALEAPKLKSLDLQVDRKDQARAKKGLEAGAATANGMTVARELGNLPGNICTPTYLAEQAENLGKNCKNFTTKVLSEAQMKRLGMGALLSVSAGSDQPAKLIVMEYKGAAASAKPHVIVGKGITFDSGGISIKPGATMDEMKFDMCGAASVMGVMTALCELQPKVNVVGVIAAAENMPSGGATKPGDVVTSMSGQTIEILNTDAEGRLVLCDALTYVERYKPRSVIDIATLTGACVVALGAHISGMLSNNDKLADTLYQCGQRTLDPVWRLPMGEEYQKQLKSNFADMANIGGGKAGTITAACFLARFTGKYHWAHLDIAGTAWLQGEQKGATGRPVPLLLDYLLNN